VIRPTQWSLLHADGWLVRQSKGIEFLGAKRRFRSDKDSPQPLVVARRGCGIHGSNQTATLDCGGGAEIAGSNNKLTLRGGCTKLEMFGSGNTVSIAFGQSANIQLVGSASAITWIMPNGNERVVQDLGSGNTLARRR
jgi:hypothetical protein